jgi:predicted DNA-binding transcriptional regulator YafY
MQMTTFAVQSICTTKNGVLMPINKHALIRYKILDRCFRNTGRNYFFEDLKKEIDNALLDLNPGGRGISRRQLFLDIRFMESEEGWLVPLDKVRLGNKLVYRYEDPKFSISNQPLNVTEIKQMESALQIMERFSGLPQFEWVSELIPVMENQLGIKGGGQKVISFDSNIDYTGQQFLGPVFNAIANRRVLLVTYQDFKSAEPYKLVFHPYYLKQYNNRWFAFGLNEELGEPAWTLSLDRIQTVGESAISYQECDTDWDEYFFDIIGVTRLKEREVEEIKLKFTAAIAPYISTKPLHPTQKENRVEDGLEVRIQVIPNYELESLLLSFGENIKVLQPEWLAGKLSERIEKMKGVYPLQQ